MCALNDEGRQNNNVINYVINYVINNVINLRSVHVHKPIRWSYDSQTIVFYTIIEPLRSTCILPLHLFVSS